MMPGRTLDPTGVAMSKADDYVKGEMSAPVVHLAPDATVGRPRTEGRRTVRRPWAGTITSLELGLEDATGR